MCSPARGRACSGRLRPRSRSDDTVYVPQNHVHQYVNTSDTEPLRLLVAQNRLIKYLGYDNVVYFEDAPEFSGAEASVPATA